MGRISKDYFALSRALSAAEAPFRDDLQAAQMRVYKARYALMNFVRGAAGEDYSDFQGQMLEEVLDAYYNARVAKERLEREMAAAVAPFKAAIQRANELANEEEVPF